MKEEFPDWFGSQISQRHVDNDKDPEHWVIDPTAGTYNVEKIRWARPENITAREWDKYIQFWNDHKNITRAAQNRQNRTKNTVISQQRSQSLARLRDEMRQSSTTQEYPSLIDIFFVAHTVNEEFLRDEDRHIYEIRRLEATGTYTDDEINRLARGGVSPATCRRGKCATVALISLLGNMWDPPFRWGLSLGKESLASVPQRTFPGDKSSGKAEVKEPSFVETSKFTCRPEMQDLSLALMGRVKECALLANLKKTLCIEGFDNLKISYLGEPWVLLEFESSKAKEFFSNNTGAGSWFSVFQQADDNFVLDGRLAWMEVDGIPFKLCTGKTFRRIASKRGELLDVEEEELNFHSKRICIFTKVRQIIHESFKVIFRGKVHWVRAIEVPGWTPEFSEEEEEEDLSVKGNFDGNHETQEVNNNFDESDDEKVLETEFEVPIGKKDCKSEDPFGIYSLLQKNKPNTESKVIEEDHSLSHPPGFTPEGDQFDGNSIGGIAEKVIEEKENGVWLKSGIDLLIVVVYAPQYAKEKRMLWEYLTHISNTWDETSFDYEPIPFRFYRYWLDVDGFDKMVRDSWEAAPGNKNNDIRSFMEDLRVCDEKIDKGMGSMEVVQNRLEILNKIHEVQKNQASEISQKAKIKWAIEGDENVKFFHGILNKKRSQSQIRGVMANGMCIEDPTKVKCEFLEHFRDDVFGAVEYFFIHGDMPKGCNSNFIALIPKIIDANMTNIDGPFILNEVLQWCRKKKKHALIFKVYFEKAYDSVRWDFLDDVLDKFGFGAKWRTWIQSCLRSSRGSILINGSPTEEFQFFRGLKQGDPLSPFLFILVMESLHISFQRVVNAGLFKGINVSSTVNLSHLFYADDAIFIGQWNELNIDTLIRVLECFFRASGLRINMCKSKIMGVNVEMRRLNPRLINLDV
nr:RNA-directed DNA polymerase, eukaryota [Tanacetum cinerariifolium]